MLVRDREHSSSSFLILLEMHAPRLGLLFEFAPPVLILLHPLIEELFQFLVFIAEIGVISLQIL